MRFFLIMPTATLSFVLRSAEHYFSLEDNKRQFFMSCVVALSSKVPGLKWENFQTPVSSVWSVISPARAPQPHMTKLHDELGLHTLTTITTITTITITSEVIIEVPGRVVVVVGGPGRLQPVQVVDEGLHDLRLDQLPAWGLNRGRVPLPRTDNYLLFSEKKIFQYLRKYFNFYLTFIWRFNWLWRHIMPGRGRGGRGGSDSGNKNKSKIFIKSCPH